MNDTLEKIEQMKALEDQKLYDLVYGNPFEQKVPPAEVYKLLLKKKRMGAFLQQALREAGFEDLAKRSKFSRQTLSEEELE